MAPVYADDTGDQESYSPAVVKLQGTGGISFISLEGPAKIVYTIYDLDGNMQARGLAGNSSWMTDQIVLNLKTEDIYYRVSTNEFVQIGPGATFEDTSKPLTLTFNFVDSTNHSIYRQESFDVPSDLYNSDFVSTLKTQALPISGYFLNSSNPVTASENNTTFTYHYIADPDSGSDSGSSSNSSSDSSSNSGAGSSSNTNTSSSLTPPKTAVTQPSASNTTSKASPLAVKGTAIYATKKIGLYTSPNFKATTRNIWYVKKSRQNRPKFIVTGYKRSQNGTLRYRIRDINHNSLTNDRRGYITANSQYVQPLYYQSQPTKIRVIAAKGLNGYHHVDLSGRIARHYKRGSVLKVTAIRDYHLTTRMMLPNGQYVSGNKTLVIKK
ncbi:DUF5776 domain-containing protein [Levilactobacillus lanxiensis]|nr:DUF5776 domain-containing protein [Levilactobacillus lanxiensis]